ncbi:putative permease [Niallia circulans]|jgi:hypothetical protein|uniref:YIP1 family protein n=1 Tax=Shouchella clausii TaxID=79880 RepID=UPI000BA52153|nr:YIP1 family protein [Shouchella clausii]MCM3547467.1 YIP1 family protein [Shouchella clausii]PAF16250.1 hypothetical protein CHH59_01025 [Shouchella clausii]SPU21896.1 putative permease [Niallia circulans]
MEQFKEAHQPEEFAFSKKPNIFAFLFNPSKQFVRMKVEPSVGFPMFIILCLVLLGLLFPVFTGQGGLIDLDAVAYDGDMDGMMMEEGIYMEDAMYEEEAPLFASFNIDGLVSGIIIGIIMLVAYAAGPPLLALILFAISKMQNNQTPYKAIYSMTVFATLASAIGFLYLMIVNAANGTYGYIYTAPSVFVNETHPFYSLLQSLEISTLAFVAFISLGLIKTANFKKFPAIAIGAGIFALVLIVNLLGGLLR